MYLAALKLNNFRNYSRQEISFHPQINIFSGLNAQGKTNLLEAIYYLTAARSFRTNQELDLLRFESDFFSLGGILHKKEGRFKIELLYRPSQPLQIRVNSLAIRRGEYLYRYPVVTFTPDDLLLIKEGPSRRRRFLDTEGSRLKPFYHHRLRDYYRVLQQRNRVLKEKRSGRRSGPGLMEPWDEALIELGAIIVRERIKLLKALETQARSHFLTLAGEQESLALCYLSTIEFSEDPGRIEDIFREQLSAGYTDELRRGATLTGPHLDDFAIAINGSDARKFASQGQQRTAVLALKIGEIDLFKRSGTETILLLDDIFSEFDEKRGDHLLQFLSERDGQSFITTASPLAGEGRLAGCSKSYSIDGGKIRID